MIKGIDWQSVCFNFCMNDVYMMYLRGRRNSSITVRNMIFCMLNVFSMQKSSLELINIIKENNYNIVVYLSIYLFMGITKYYMSIFYYVFLPGCWCMHMSTYYQYLCETNNSINLGITNICVLIFVAIGSKIHSKRRQSQFSQLE